MASRIRSILITNAIALNGGDAAILQATIAILKRRFGDDIRITVHDMKADASSLYYPALAFRRDVYSETVDWTRGRVRPLIAAIAVLATAKARRLPLLGSAMNRLLPAALQRTLSDYAEADLVVSSGGTYLVPHYALASKLLDFLVAQALKKPLVLFTQSLGPFPPGKRQFVLRHALRRTALILVRDRKSLRHLRELDIAPARARLCADAAFALAPRNLEGRSFQLDQRHPRIAISVRDWPHFSAGQGGDGMERYLASMAALTGNLIEQRGAHVTFISTCQGTPEYWTDDACVAAEIVRRLPDALCAHVMIDRAFHRPAELIARFATFDLTIATRFHAAILSLCAGTPVMPVAYEFKTSELFTRLGLGDSVVEIEDISPDKALAAIEKAAALWSRHAEDIWAAVMAERQSAFSAADQIARALGLPAAAATAPVRGNALQAGD
jgi:colanic acid/amylovoran biosynthesis protein